MAGPKKRNDWLFYGLCCLLFNLMHASDVNDQGSHMEILVADLRDVSKIASRPQTDYCATRSGVSFQRFHLWQKSPTRVFYVLLGAKFRGIHYYNNHF